MPLLDVSQVLADPRFQDNTLVRIRNTQTVGSDGIASNSTASASFSGVVTQATGDQLIRTDGGSYISGSILVHSTFPLSAGAAGQDADVIAWRGRNYTVKDVADWSDYGRGFTCATCEPLALSGS